MSGPMDNDDEDEVKAAARALLDAQPPKRAVMHVLVQDGTPHTLSASCTCAIHCTLAAAALGLSLGGPLHAALQPRTALLRDSLDSAPEPARPDFGVR